ncbi:glycerol-3-phosphate ABC transporter ATP-binding protein [Aneurinibacillus migulanus]|uniref:Glycerol-3-phosphate ABC transporter ATP-binding protein n=1 Tax=Aneurinibacillus migulanus TaxID=47500 RepID=A0A0D1Y342_ANEMI|nr:sn-glycerol-3-phosphate ABC transporter ATP-binding protein UgpC [Aneurinibacillus migulanus]KIV53811.1 glycerol-3-phosphate ABC transporter ATP-binding protein [Aneurinibacillus migulanus]KIV58763.1 glycerol-3-phosphate ABC transporter ATP-binding protein [Aneurinibacillus migulanus]KON96454.1 glycerol-3-phosphate ABC transporter ATP-binding protein [Aneurinibacillus migulanus]KPD04634.1 glycerol-3-phosphate ABC transporter ATP-binding protein [Aneurinibacillus migulanus]MCP1357042.1 sn-gl
MAGVTLQGICKSYNNVAVVDNMNLEIRDGEFLVLVGPSGCGKSTTLRMIAGLEDISDGDLYIDSVRINDMAPKNRDIAMVFQNYALYPHMNVYENMAFGLKLRKLRKDEIDRRVKEAAAMLGLASLLDRKPKALSGGQRQRVALGRAIVREPQVFLMDEPLSNLDAKLRIQMRTEISKLQRRLGTTTIYVTHDQTEAMTMGDRIVVLQGGRIQQVATPTAIYEKPKNLFVASFIGSPSMNFIEGAIKVEDSEVLFVNRDVRLMIPEKRAKVLKDMDYINKPVILGIRPEDIQVEVPFTETHLSDTINTRVEFVENMGAELYLYMSGIGENTIIARSESSVQTHVGERIKIAFAMDKIHLFDKETTASIFLSMESRDTQA